MSYKLRATFIFCLGLTTACGLTGGEDDRDDLTLATLAVAAQSTLNANSANQCTTVPGTFVDSGAGTYTCTFSNLTYSCVNGGTTFTRVYPSVAVLRLGVIDSPGVGLSLHPGFRGSSIALNATTVSYTLDGSNRITGTTGGATFSYSNHDTNGFPQGYNAGGAGTVAYTYPSGAILPSTVSVSGTLTQSFSYNSNGWATSYNVGGGARTVSTSSPITVCP